MNAKQNMKLPAECTLMTEEEMLYTDGGGAAEIAVKAVIAVGGAAVLLAVGGIAARGILSVFDSGSGLAAVIQSSIDGGKRFIEDAVGAGENFLNALTGR